MSVALLVVPEVASAQSWWPFGSDEEEERPPPVPSEPVYREPPGDVPAPMPQQSPAPAPSGRPGAPPAARNYSTKNPICYQLEQRLVQENAKGSQSRNELPRIEDEIRVIDRTFNVSQSQLDRDCYEHFLFTKTFRNTPKCKDLARQVEVSKRRLADLEAQRQDILNSSGRSYQDDIIRELARNNCGANYVDMARRRSDGMWEDEESTATGNWSPRLPNGMQTYRTVCVRLCDGYYFPVSFSTLPSHFEQDANVCASQCAAPAELFYYPTGETVKEAVSLKSQQAYSELKHAFRYRKEYVAACSCKASAYKPEQAEAGGKTNSRAAQSTPAANSNGAAALAQPPPSGATAPTALPPAASAGDWQTQAQRQSQ
jgi:hypothetical protein